MTNTRYPRSTKTWQNNVTLKIGQDWKIIQPEHNLLILVLLQVHPANYLALTDYGQRKKITKHDCRAQWQSIAFCRCFGCWLKQHSFHWHLCLQTKTWNQPFILCQCLAAQCKWNCGWISSELLKQVKQKVTLSANYQQIYQLSSFHRLRN